MEKPSSAQAPYSVHALLARPISTSDRANSRRLMLASTGRPPCRSIQRPARGPIRPDTTIATEKAAYTPGTGRPSSRAIGAERIAGR